MIGAFPTANCRDVAGLDRWLTEIDALIDQNTQRSGRRAAPVCPNLIVHRSNPRLADDMHCLIRHRVEMVIAGVGSPEAVIVPLHDAGALVFADVASMRHTEKAIRAGVDGLVLLSPA